MSDSIRKEFEAWLAETQGRHMVSTWNERTQDYNHLACTIALEAWKASRAAIEVELPFPGSFFSGGPEQEGAEIYHHYVADTIRNQGLKVKP